MLCDDLEGWDEGEVMGGVGPKRRGYMYTCS